MFIAPGATNGVTVGGKVNNFVNIFAISSNAILFPLQ